MKKENDRPIIPAKTAIETFRDSGYKSTASAIAELIDNSIEAEADDIQILTFEKLVEGPRRTTKQISKIAIYDNGLGMTSDVLSIALQFGHGTRMTSRKGIGRFGIGLPNASVSQCRRVDLYSWRDEKCHHTHLDVDEVKELELQNANKVRRCEMPSDILAHIEGKPRKSGTLVVWSKCDRLDLRKSNTLFNHMKGDLCRIFRHFLDEDDTYGTRRVIRMVEIGTKGKDVSRDLRPNDPLYLMSPNYVPSAKNAGTNIMHGNVEKLPVFYYDDEGKKRETVVELRYSIALPETQSAGGNSDLGKHYAKNTGISIMRAAREIDFGNFGFFNNLDARERWWGCEIRFEPVLDEVFGVNNNKQSVRGLRYIDEVQFKKENADWKERLEEDARVHLCMELSRSFSQNHRSMMDIIRGRGAGSRGGATAEKLKASLATQVANERVKKANKDTGTKRESETLTEEQKATEWKERLVEDHPELTEPEVKDLVTEKLGLAVDKEVKGWPGAQFFSRDRVGSTCMLLINHKHPFYKEFYERIMEESDSHHLNALDLLMYAYIQMEDELYGEVDNLEMMRETWGRYVRDFLKDLASTA
jgi:hypothetical protein